MKAEYWSKKELNDLIEVFYARNINVKIKNLEETQMSTHMRNKENNN